jgi:hypothetical protein
MGENPMNKQDPPNGFVELGDRVCEIQLVMRDTSPTRSISLYQRLIGQSVRS